MPTIRQGRLAAPHRILIYGPGKVGKTTLASQAPAPIFIPTEEGCNEIDCDKYELCASYQDVHAAIADLFRDSRGYRTVVLDSLEWLETLIWREVARNAGVGAISEIPFGKGYDHSLPWWSEITGGLDALRHQRQMQVVLIGHSKIERFANPAADSYDRYEPRLHKAASAMIREWVDDILFLNWRVQTISKDAGFGRTEVKVSQTAQRVLYTSERPSHVAGNRLGLPEEMEPRWADLAAYLPVVEPPRFTQVVEPASRDREPAA